MASGSEFLMENLTKKAEIERKALMGLRYVATTVSVTPQYEYLCRPKRLEPIPWEHVSYRLGLGLRTVAMLNESRLVTTKPFGRF
jgi:hypothetical protein